MNYLKFVSIVLLLAAWGCSNDTLIGLESQDSSFTPETEIQPPQDSWIARSVNLDASKVDAALAGGNNVMQVALVTYYPDPDIPSMLQCFDAAGNPVPGVALPLRFLVEGRVQYLGQVTGYFGGGSCLVNADFTLTVLREWFYKSKEGHAIYGEYIATVYPDGSFTSKDTVTGGIGKFAGASGWGRSAGKAGTVYTRGILTAPGDVVARTFIAAWEGQSDSGSIPCVDVLGNPTVTTVTGRIEGPGLSNYGPADLVGINERCVDHGDVLVVYGSAIVSFAQGDELRATNRVVIGTAVPWPNTLVITGGTGRFEGVSGWAESPVYWDEGRGDEQGVLFFAR